MSNYEENSLVSDLPRAKSIDPKSVNLVKDLYTIANVIPLKSSQSEQSHNSLLRIGLIEESSSDYPSWKNHQTSIAIILICWIQPKIQTGWTRPVPMSQNQEYVQKLVSIPQTWIICREYSAAILPSRITRKGEAEGLGYADCIQCWVCYQ